MLPHVFKKMFSQVDGHHLGNIFHFLLKVSSFLIPSCETGRSIFNGLGCELPSREYDFDYLAKRFNYLYIRELANKTQENALVSDKLALVSSYACSYLCACSLLIL